MDEVEKVTFKSLGVSPALCEACELQNWTSPTEIQQKLIPIALKGKEVIGLAKTGSGKTAAFAIPILQHLQAKPQRMFALILTPTRELAFQISDQIKSLGSFLNIKCAVIVGGTDIKEQARILNESPHIVIGTPGRLVYHLHKTKGFYLDNVKYLVLDEADKILGQDFEEQINEILLTIPKEKRRTYLFSATMTNNVQKLERVAQENPVRIEVSQKYDSVETLEQIMMCVPEDKEDKLNFLVQVVIHHENMHIIVFCAKCETTILVAKFLKNVGYATYPINGQMPQEKRLNSLAKFKSDKKSILVATDVASRGLDIPLVGLVVNFDVPANSKDYLHRVGRTARAGNDGKAITFANCSEKEAFLKIEQHTQVKMKPFKIDWKDVELLKEEVHQAYELAQKEISQYVDSRGRKRNGMRDFQTKAKFKKRKH